MHEHLPLQRHAVLTLLLRFLLVSRGWERANNCLLHGYTTLAGQFQICKQYIELDPSQRLTSRLCDVSTVYHYHTLSHPPQELVSTSCRGGWDIIIKRAKQESPRNLLQHFRLIALTYIAQTSRISIRWLGHQCQCHGILRCTCTQRQTHVRHCWADDNLPHIKAR